MCQLLLYIAQVPTLTYKSKLFLYLKQFRFILFSGFILLNVFACKKDSSSEDHVPAVFIQETEDGYELMRNGNPFHIKGAAAQPEYLEELQEAGANTARVYDTVHLKETLDAAHRLGLAVVVDIPLPKFHKDPEFWEDEELFGAMKKGVEEVVTINKDHPALLYWNLGNELYYPYFYKSTDFHSNFNELVDLVQAIDNNHPVSTTTIGANKLKVVSIRTRTPQLDFISFNSFGTLTVFREKLEPISAFWDGPYVIGEWGINGPWEAPQTSWNVPIEETSTKKAEQIRERYYQLLKPLKDQNSFGGFIFYWGIKTEATPTWFSLFGKNNKKTQAVFELNKIWTGHDSVYKGPQLDYILLNEQGAFDNIILLPNQEVTAEVKLPDNLPQDLEYEWEIRPESWFKRLETNVLEGVDFQIQNKNVTFKAPKEEGPYRIYVYLTDDTEYFATANIPFYVLAPDNAD